MRNHFGIWLSHKDAIIVKIDGDQHSVERVESELDRKSRSTGGTKGKSGYVHRSVNSAGKNAAHRKDQQLKHYAAILKLVPKTGSMLLLGPGQAKTEFLEFLKEKRSIKVDVIGVEGTGRITEGQLVAKIKRSFGTEPRAEQFRAKSKESKR